MHAHRILMHPSKSQILQCNLQCAVCSECLLVSGLHWISLSVALVRDSSFIFLFVFVFRLSFEVAFAICPLHQYVARCIIIIGPRAKQNLR